MAGTGQQLESPASRLAGCLAAEAGCLTDSVLETWAACRISSLLQAAAGSIFSPPAPMGLEGRGGLSRRGELKVNVCRHNGEGLPLRGRERPFLQKHGALAFHSLLYLPVIHADQRLLKQHVQQVD